MVSYPSADELEKFNVLVLGIVSVKKGDKHEVLSSGKLLAALEQCRLAEGSIYVKAAVLMRSLCIAHAFASGNRRTAFVAAKDFVVRNKGKFMIPDDPNYAPVMRGIREGRYPIEEIAEWIASGQIKQRER